VSGQIHSPAALTSEKETTVSNEQVARKTPVPF
jgi:hypothetical protein